MNITRIFTLILTSAALLASCKDAGKSDVKEEEDEAAKEMLQGTWIGEDDCVAMIVKGDTIFYNDSTMAPVAFAIIHDSLVLRGSTETRYAIEKQTQHIFRFRNHDGDIVRMVKSDNPTDASAIQRQPQLNQRQLIKRDTVAIEDGHKYHVYIQVNPSTYKVYRSKLNDDGVQVDNIYYDNIINVCIYDGGNRLFSRDIRKQDFSRYVPKGYLSQSVLSDISVEDISAKGIKMNAIICVPDSPTSYIVAMTVTPGGRLSMKIE
ncbi:MAG: DUF4738 domain-containing protein [Prevotella sp.]